MKTAVPSQEPSYKSEFDSSDEAIGRRLREAREGRGLTQQAVSVRSKWVDSDGKGVSRTALIGYESGASRPGARELRILCETLAVSPNYLLFGSESPFETSYPGLEALRNVSGAGPNEFSRALQVAFVLTALKGHERDAILTLALSLAGRQLGDLRLGALRAAAGFCDGPVFDALIRQVGPDAMTGQMTLEQMAERITQGGGATVGTRLRLDEDGDVVSGEWVYPDPKDRKESP